MLKSAGRFILLWHDTQNRDYAPEKISKKPAVSLFPESGNLINDTRQRVAFEVKDGEGKYVDGRFFVLNEKGDTISSTRTENRGRGCFELNIRKDDKYKAFFEDKEGEQTRVSLPDILLAGAAMKVEQDASSVKAYINIQGIERDSIRLLVTTFGVADGMHKSIVNSEVTLDELFN